MTTAWNYTRLAASYSKRPEYAPDGIDAMLETAGVAAGSRVCDVGAGTGHLTLALLQRNLMVQAVEPNDAMRAIGIARTQDFPAVTWDVGTGEDTGQATAAFDLVTFGSSFNVTDREKALVETVRILKPAGWFACMWNHRDLDDPLQARIEAAIAALIPEYAYGARREDQTAVIDCSGLFHPVRHIKVPVLHRIPTADWQEAWRSHATLQRQAGDRFEEVLAAIDGILAQVGQNELAIPYTTRIWLAQKR